MNVLPVINLFRDLHVKQSTIGWNEMKPAVSQNFLRLRRCSERKIYISGYLVLNLDDSDTTLDAPCSFSLCVYSVL